MGGSAYPKADDSNRQLLAACCLSDAGQPRASPSPTLEMLRANSAVCPRQSALGCIAVETQRTRKASGEPAAASATRQRR